MLVKQSILRLCCEYIVALVMYDYKCNKLLG